MSAFEAVELEGLTGKTGLISDGDWIESRDQDPAGSIRLVQLADIGDGAFLNRSQRFINNETAERLRCTMLQPGDVLIARMPDPLGRACVFPDIGQSAITAVDVCILRTAPELASPDWVVAALNAPDTRRQIEKFAQGATRARVPTGQLRKLTLRVPNVDAQRRIAADLNAQLATVAGARHAAQAQLKELTQLANSIVRESIAHPDTEARLLGEVLEEVKRGIGAAWADYPVLGATRAGLALAKEPVGKNPERYKPVRVGTVFYNPMRILIGSIAMVDEADAPGITSPDYVALRGREGVVDSRWFYYWLRSPLGEQCIASLARGAVRERMLFNRLAEGEIELPPYPVQQAASRALAELRPMKAKIEAQLREIELLPSRLLAQVFGSSR